MKEKLKELLIKADENAAGKMITDYKDAVDDNADYLLANGVIVPPCKVGDTVYRVSKQWNPDKLIWETILTEEGIAHAMFSFYCTTSQDNIFRDVNFGKTVFLSREEAEAALEGADDDK